MLLMEDIFIFPVENVDLTKNLFIGMYQFPQYFFSNRKFIKPFHFDEVEMLYFDFTVLYLKMEVKTSITSQCL